MGSETSGGSGTEGALHGARYPAIDPPVGAVRPVVCGHDERHGNVAYPALVGTRFARFSRRSGAISTASVMTNSQNRSWPTTGRIVELR